MAKKPFGSGNFGEWFTDDFGLPAYLYTCDQRRDPRAFTPVSPEARSGSDHVHQVGNDRLVAIASNYGYIQVRQDEGGPKLLNDWDPPRGRYAGGFGYLAHGDGWLSTLYPGRGESFTRVFGVGYYRKRVTGSGFVVDQVVFAPFGDDPLVISRVTVTNQRATAARVRWIEHWGCQAYQLSHRATVLSAVSRGRQRVSDLRRSASERYRRSFSTVGKREGLLERKNFLGYDAAGSLRWALAQAALATVGRRFARGALRAPVKEASLEDSSPPPTFLVSLDAPTDGMGTDGESFFGAGGAEDPDGLGAPLSMDEGGDAMFLERQLDLQPGESRALFFAYGYLPMDVALERLLDTQRGDLKRLWEKSSGAWKERRVSLSVPDEPWVDREMAWHSYYLRSGLTYDSFFREHILSQGGVYQYVIGFQGAARDPLQHALPFIFTEPWIVKEVIRYTLKEVLSDGEIPYAVVGAGMRMAVPFRPSDQELWLLWLASEYVLATRDRAFLDETIPTFPVYGPGARRESVRALLARCYRHLTCVTGVGKHGLLRMSNGDWNDGAVLEFVPRHEEEDVRRHGESVLNAAFAAYALSLYSQLLTYAGDSGPAEDARAWAEGQRRAVQEQWHGRWFRRSWLGEARGWIGEDVMWLEPQPWAIIGGAATPEQARALAATLDETVRRPSPIGAMLTSAALKESRLSPGALTNAGVWPSINGTLVWALACVDGAAAWDEWKKNTLACHAEAYPDVWYGIWSGPDAYNSVLSKYPGQTYFDEKVLLGEPSDTPLGSGANWTDFPVMNMHPHAWPLYDAAKLIGAVFTPEGLEVSPSLPLAVYRFATPLLGLEKSEEGYAGWYAPGSAGTWRMTLRLAGEERARFTRLEVNGSPREYAVRDDGAIQWVAESAPVSPAQWRLTSARS
jgi:hypothetical protein